LLFQAGSRIFVVLHWLERVIPLVNSHPTPLASPLTPPTTADRLSQATWLNGRLALGILLVLGAVLGGALFLRAGQQLVGVYAAARDLPSGTVLTPADLRVVRVRLPDPELRHYLQPATGRPRPGRVPDPLQDRSPVSSGRVLTTPVPKDALLPAAAVASSVADAGMVELAVTAEPGDLAQGLRPGDRVQERQLGFPWSGYYIANAV
jgi:SAF domain